MEFERFQHFVERARKEKPLLLELEPDRPPQMQEVLEFQRQHKLQLPEGYRQFLLHYGGGYFGYAILYSLDPDSCFYLGAQNPEEPGAFLRVADNECGDDYGLPIQQGICGEEVYFLDHETQTAEGPVFADVLEYLVKEGLRYELEETTAEE